ncbi:MAG: hypothetical protein EXQ97_03310 [Alphaproteobacteria bacterium]|nr:hypothetical protein [Alphaproteobacteria bacterium]
MTASAHPRWPYDGALAVLLAQLGLTVAETYPGEFYTSDHLDLGIRHGLKSKTNRTHRDEGTGRLLRWAETVEVSLTNAARDAISTGFATDHYFDAMVGLLGMINILRGNRS